MMPTLFSSEFNLTFLGNQVELAVLRLFHCCSLHTVLVVTVVVTYCGYVFTTFCFLSTKTFFRSHVILSRLFFFYIVWVTIFTVLNPDCVKCVQIRTRKNLVRNPIWSKITLMVQNIFHCLCFFNITVFCFGLALNGF